MGRVWGSAPHFVRNISPMGLHHLGVRGRGKQTTWSTAALAWFDSAAASGGTGLPSTDRPPEIFRH